MTPGNEPAAPSLAEACERLGLALIGLSQAGAAAMAATSAIESGDDVPRLSAALDVLASRVVDVQRAVSSYRALTELAQRGWESRRKPH